MSKIITAFVFICMVLPVVALFADDESTGQKLRREAVELRLRQAKQRKIRRLAIAKRQAKNKPAAKVKAVRLQFTQDINLKDILTKSGLISLMSRVSDCPQAMAFMKEIVDAGRPVLCKDRAAMLIMVSIQEAKEAYGTIK